MEIKEKWLDVVGYEGLYQVSDLGRIKRDGHIKATYIDKGGYITVSLSKKSKQKTLKVHRLVALAFIPNPDGKITVNHIDGNKHNNSVKNLEWSTHSENHKHAYRLGLKIVTDAQRQSASRTGKRTCELNRRKKAVIGKNETESYSFPSAHDGARFVKGHACAIIRCCKGKQKTHKGLEWRYA